jgi:hypothetical protein
MARRTKLIFLSAGLLAAALYFFWSPPATETFSPAMISSSLPPQPKWSIPDPTPEEDKNLHEILSQKFTMIGEGEQAVAFESADKKYVLKVFKMSRFMPSFTDQLCPHVVRRRLRNLNWLFNGYKNAFQDLRQETGLVWIHLAKTNALKQKVALVDNNGKEHLIDADAVEFVIQERAELIFDHISRLYKEGKGPEAEKALDSFYAFIQHRTDKGYMDRDKAVTYNYGFVGDRPIQIDLGRLYKRQNRKARDPQLPLERIRQRVEEWKGEQVIEASSK